MYIILNIKDEKSWTKEVNINVNVINNKTLINQINFIFFIANIIAIIKTINIDNDVKRKFVLFEGHEQYPIHSIPFDFVPDKENGDNNSITSLFVHASVIPSDELICVIDNTKQIIAEITDIKITK